jgi:pimeloyl-ACP methyl ester carboxylesterase
MVVFLLFSSTLHTFRTYYAMFKFINFIVLLVFVCRHSSLASLILPPPTHQRLSLPAGVTSSYIDASTACRLVFHVLTAEYDPQHQMPLILLLYGAPELAFVLLSDFQRTGYQGALNWYRVLTFTQMTRDTLLLADAKVRVPTAFVIGANDWSSYLNPGAIDRQNQSCTDFRRTVVVPDYGHWVPEERP